MRGFGRQLIKAALALVLGLGSTAGWALKCDVDNNARIDRADLTLIQQAVLARLPVSGPDDPRDADNNLVINSADGRICALRCKYASCATNGAPVANAGPDQAVALGASVTLNAAASSDPDGNALSYRWTLSTRPAGSAAALVGANTARPSFRVDQPGNYMATLIVNDGSLDSVADTVTISTTNSAPSANAGPDQTVRVTDTVTLSGAASSDPDGNALSYRWTLASRPAGSVAALTGANTLSPTFVADRPGNYVATLVVNDGTVDSAADSVTVSTINSAPRANAGPDQTARVGDTVQLDGRGSSDVDGDALSYSWRVVSAPAGSTAALSSTSALQPVVSIDVAGSYIFELIVNDGSVNSAADTVSVSTTNSPPVARPGNDRSVPLGTQVTLDGSASFDVDGNALSFAWSLTARPSGSAATLSSPTAVTPSFVADVPGNYVVQLIVNDGSVNSAAASVTISTDNARPTAHAGADQTVPLGSGVQLDGSASSDPEGAPLSYNWSISSRPAGSTASLSASNVARPTFTADRAGSYVVQLIVGDGALNSAPDTVIISTLNSRPVAVAGPAQAVNTGATVQLDGSGSSDADGDALTYAWSLTTRPAGSAAVLSNPGTVNPSFVADVPGGYVAQLIVSDAALASVPATVTVNATTPNRAPVAVAAATPATVNVGSPVALSSAGSSDPDGNALSYTWALAARPAGSNAAVASPAAADTRFTPDLPGNYTVQLTVSDGTLSATAQADVTATAVNHPPVADAGPDQAVQLGAVMSLNGAASSDPDGNPITFDWTLLSRPPGSAAALSGPTSATPSFVADQSGSYVVQLVVRDASLASTPDTVLVTASAAAGQQTSGTIGPAGGVLTLPDGTRLAVPAGALPGATTITITEAALAAGTVMPPTGVLAGKVYTFEPDGLVFAVPATLTIPYDPALLPAGYAEGDILIHRRSTAPQFHVVGNEDGSELESPGQLQDLVAKTLTVNILGFSQYGAVGNNQAGTWVSSTITSANGAASVVVRRPPTGMRTQKSVNQGNCNAGAVALPARAATGVQGVVIHTTNGANPAAGINGALGWAANDCVRDFAHYMIDKDGTIYQVVDDGLVVNHVGGVFSPAVTPRNDLVNANTVGIEILNNVGEPYDGQQIAALIRLLDFLHEAHALPRPARDPATGLYVRNRTNISTGGERVITHFDFNGKCDPIGSMRSSGVYYPVNNVQGCATPAVPIAQGDANAPSLLDAIFDTLAMLQRDRQHTGIIQASGGDALGVAAPGNGGNVALREDAAAVAAVLGVVRPRLATENTPLIVGPGATRALTGQQTFTDAIIAGRLEVNGDLDLRLIGTLYLAPNGRIVLRRGNDGGNLTITTRGIPVIQGLIDTIGNDGPSADAAGGQGGAVTIISAGSAPWLVPTIISRGGDADFASAGFGTGGTGGNVTIDVQSSSVVLGGGVGVQTVANDISSARPPVRDQVDRNNLPSAPDYIGDRLPPPPPFNKYTSIAVGTRTAGVKEPLRTAGFQQGFARGILTTGGIGGTGLATAADDVDGGTGGAGGNISLTVTAQGRIQFKDVDLVTGADVETAVKSLILPEGGANLYAYFPASGSLGGTGRNQTGNRSGGFGGAGGQAGHITVAGALFPAPASFAPVGPLGSGEIIGIDRPLHSVRPRTSDDFIFDFIFGRRIEAADAAGNRLYRLRLGLTNDTLLGGSGGVPAGGIAGEFPGWFGSKGADGTLIGLPAR